MTRRVCWSTAFAAFLLVLVSAAPAGALDEPDRLWLVGEGASADGLHVVARRALEQLVERFPNDKRAGDAWLLLGKARLGLGDHAPALEAFRKAQSFSPTPGRPLEAKFWEAEVLFRLKRYAEARDAYDTIIKTDAASPLAPDALYGYAWSELELGQASKAAMAFSELIKTWPDHPATPAAGFYLARALVEEKRTADAIPHLQAFVRSQPGHKLAPDARYLLGWARVETGDFKAGLEDLRAFVQQNPSHNLVPAARKIILDTQVRHGDREELQDVYRVLMTATPATPEALADAASVAGRLGRPADQEAAWRRLRSQFPAHPLARRAALDLAAAAYRKKDWKETVTQGQAAAQSDDETVRGEALLMVGEAQLKLKQWGPAERAFDGALAVTSLDDAVRFRALAGLGLAHEEQREWKSALTAYETVASQSTDATLRDWAKERATAVRARTAKPEPKPAPEKKVPDKSGNGRKVKTAP